MLNSSATCTFSVKIFDEGLIGGEPCEEPRADPSGTCNLELEGASWKPRGIAGWEPCGVASWEPRGIASWEPRGVASWEPRGVASWERCGIDVRPPEDVSEMSE
mmetsp:Transcript_41468/g.88355  ORF Transcript_41468/g.88355 Transcript_41468/m.88355 type:complete len:104 (+) Transcript_41468:1048-1359(+)